MDVKIEPRTGEDVAFFEWLAGPEGGNCRMAGDLGGGRYCAIKPLLFHWTLIIGEIGDKEGFEDRFCYADRASAATGLIEWSSREWKGEPEGWHRHPATGRRRPGGDKAREYHAR